MVPRHDGDERPAGGSERPLATTMALVRQLGRLLRHDEQLYDRVLVAVGRRPNAGELGLEDTRARTDRGGFVEVDAQRRAAEPSVFATGGPVLAHKATREGEVAAEAVGETAAALGNRAIHIRAGGGAPRGGER